MSPARSLSRSLLMDLVDMTRFANKSPSALSDDMAEFRIRPLNWAPISIANVFKPADNTCDIQAIAFNYGNDLVVAFGGSYSPETLSLERVPFDELGENAPQVAAGLLEQWRSISEVCTEWLSNWIGSRLKGTVYLVGHSIGGNLAAMQAITLAEPERSVHVSFGAMRLFTSEFTSAFAVAVPESVRVVNGRDLVPTLAMFFEGRPSRLHHVGQVQHFQRTGASANSEMAYYEKAQVWISQMVTGEERSEEESAVVRSTYFTKARQLTSKRFNMDEHDIDRYAQVIGLWSGK